MEPKAATDGRVSIRVNIKGDMTMKTSTGMIAAVTLSLLAGSALAEPTRDCML